MASYPIRARLKAFVAPPDPDSLGMPLLQAVSVVEWDHYTMIVHPQARLLIDRESKRSYAVVDGSILFLSTGADELLERAMKYFEELPVPEVRLSREGPNKPLVVDKPNCGNGSSITFYVSPEGALHLMSGKTVSVASVVAECCGTRIFMARGESVAFFGGIHGNTGRAVAFKPTGPSIGVFDSFDYSIFERYIPVLVVCSDSNAPRSVSEIPSLPESILNPTIFM